MGLKFKVKVPGTSANIGVGYDCLGVALDYFLELEVEESDKIEFLENGEPFSIPIEENLIFEAIKYTEKHLVKNIPSYKVNIVKNDIPMRWQDWLWKWKGILIMWYPQSLVEWYLLHMIRKTLYTVH